MSLYENINKRKKAGTSRSKSESKISDDAYKNMKAGFPKKMARGGAVSKTVEAPKGFHWMKSGESFKLMKDPGPGYKPHKGGSKKASFKIQKVHT
jgi:hypothetical protein